MKLQINKDYGYLGEYESKVLENKIKESSYIKSVQKETYILKNKDIHKVINELNEELCFQKEKSLFRKSRTRSLGELGNLIRTLKSLKENNNRRGDDTISFICKERKELLDI